MKILALEVETPGKTSADFAPHLQAEARQVWRLQMEGVVREVHFRTDQHAAVLTLECPGLQEARAALATLPLVAEGLIHFDLIPLAPYDGFERLFAAAAPGGGSADPVLNQDAGVD